MRSAHGAIERPGAQGAASDSEHADRVIAAAHAVGVLPHRIDQRGLKWQMRKAYLAAFAAFLKVTQPVGGHGAAAQGGHDRFRSGMSFEPEKDTPARWGPACPMISTASGLRSY